MSPRKCWQCSMPGHMARNCPYSQPVTDATPTEPVNNYQIMGSSHAYVETVIGNKATLALLDSGSQLSIAPSSLVRPRDLTESRQILKAANSTEILVIGETILQCLIGEHIFEVPCLVSPMVSELVFGLDFLERESVQWNFREKWVQLGRMRVTLRNLNQPTKCRKIVIAETVAVPPRRELDVDSYMVLPNFLPSDAGWATVPQVLENGLILGGTLLSVTFGHHVYSDVLAEVAIPHKGLGMSPRQIVSPPNSRLDGCPFIPPEIDLGPVKHNFLGYCRCPGREECPPLDMVFPDDAEYGLVCPYEEVPERPTVERMTKSRLLLKDVDKLKPYLGPTPRDWSVEVESVDEVVAPMSFLEDAAVADAEPEEAMERPRRNKHLPKRLQDFQLNDE